ncbi:YraN family protein [Paenibacillus sp. CMAA1364]
MNSEPLKKDTRKQKGAAGEEHAAIYLEEQGYKIVDRNWRCRSGEIDIVARKEDSLIIVEVRSQSGRSRFGIPAESVNTRKINQVRQTTEVYLLYKKMNIASVRVRFDVIAIILNADMTLYNLEHITDAF